MHEKTLSLRTQYNPREILAMPCASPDHIYDVVMTLGVCPEIAPSPRGFSQIGLAPQKTR